MTQNSVLSQNWVRFTWCTPKDPGCARTVPRPCAQCRVVARIGRVAGCVAHTLLCRRPLRSRYKNCIATQTLSCAVSRVLPRVSQHSCAMSLGTATPYHSLTAPYRDTKWSPPATIQNLYRDSPHSQATSTCTRLSPLRGSWPCLEAVL